MSISLKKISEETGFSTSTVSRAMKNDPRISEKTKMMIFKAAQRLGYESGNVPESNKVILFFVANPHESVESDEFFSVVQKGMIESATKENYNCLVQSIAISEDFNNTLIPLNLIKGIIAGGIPMPNSIQDFLLTLKIPVVMIGNYPKLERFGMVNNDNTKGGYLAGTQILKSHYKKNLIVTGSRALQTFSDRIEGFFRSYRENGLSIEDIEIIELDGFDEKCGKDFILDYKDKLETDTAIFCTTDWLAKGVLEGLNNLPISIPDDIGLLGFGGLSFCAHTTPKISTIALKPYLLGKISFMMLQELINGNHESKGSVFVEPAFSFGGTLKRSDT